MKNFSAFLFFALSLFALHAQTNVSGGIYTNSSWTLGNSPYIVVDTVVVFPGVTLTIEPGVVVKFENDMLLEIRDASLIAEGTISDSITFTSNAVSPTPGIWKMILLQDAASYSNIVKFNYCNFFYAVNGVKDKLDNGDSLFIRNSNFNNNTIALSSSGGNGFSGGISFFDSCVFQNSTSFGLERLENAVVNHCTIKNNTFGINLYYYCSLQNCMIDSNQTGVSASFSEVLNCTIKYNQTGLTSQGNNFIDNCIIDSNSVAGVILNWWRDTLINSAIKYNNITGVEINGLSLAHNVIAGCSIENNLYGIEINSSPNNISCNKICDNINYDLKYSEISGGNISVPNNYWCSTDSTTIANHIYDGYDDVSLGLVHVSPIDTLQCYLQTSVPS